MDLRDILLVQSSFANVVPISDAAADMFYARLFEIAPEVKPMFKGDMKGQGQKLMATLGVAVKGLSNLESILPTVKQLAQKHTEYGVLAEHYEPVGAALLWTLEQGLGDSFTEETKVAWAKAYSLLSTTMIEEAYPTVGGVKNG